MTWRSRMILAMVIAALAAVVLAGIDWGLPSRISDQYIFGSRTPWQGAELAAYDQDRANASLGADVDRNPVDRSREQVALNRTDEGRAEILRRYRLFSHQPDEMITFMALQQMKLDQLDFDPRLYQYGGLWTYAVGAMLKGASVPGWIDLRSDKAFYYTNPVEFGRFYVVARAYTLIWYIALLIVVAILARKLTDSENIAIIAAVLVGIAPVVFAMAHEAKPHLPGAVLMCLGCLAAARWVEKGLSKNAVLVGAVCGLAAGMVLSAAVVGIIIPTMLLLRRSPARERWTALLLGLVAMTAAYAITNPYVLINLIRDRAALRSNFGNTGAMYDIGPLIGSLRDGAIHLTSAASIPLIALAAASVVWVVVRRRRPSPLSVLLIVPAAIVLIQFFLLAAGKPGEYGRFAIFPVIVMAILGTGVLTAIRQPWLGNMTGIVLCAAIAVTATWGYVLAFGADTQKTNTRTSAAWRLNRLWSPGMTMQVFAEPAPYSLPPVGLWRWQILLTKPGAPLTADVVVRAIDHPNASRSTPAGYTSEIISEAAAPITWANKPFEILVRDRRLR